MTPATETQADTVTAASAHIHTIPDPPEFTPLPWYGIDCASSFPCITDPSMAGLSPRFEPLSRHVCSYGRHGADCYISSATFLWQQLSGNAQPILTHSLQIQPLSSSCPSTVPEGLDGCCGVFSESFEQCRVLPHVNFPCSWWLQGLIFTGIWVIGHEVGTPYEHLTHIRTDSEFD